MWIARAALLVSVASACNALTGADSLVAEDTRNQNANAEGGSSGTSGGTTPVTPGEDGGSSGSDATTPVTDSGAPTNPTPDPNTIALSAKFDTAAECTAWTATKGTKTYSTTLGRTAAGACVLCALEASEVSFERIGKAPVAGKLSVVAYARRQPDKTTPVSFTFTVLTANSTLSTGQSFSANEIWTQAGTAIKVGVQKDESVTVRFSVKDAVKDDCIVVDDVLAFVQ